MKRMGAYHQEKKQLIEDLKHHKSELKKQLNSISSGTQKIATNTMVIVGALFLTYSAVHQFSGIKKKQSKKKSIAEIGESDSETKNSNDFFPPQIRDTLISHAITLLLEITKKKLAAHLQSRKTDHENP